MYILIRIKKQVKRISPPFHPMLDLALATNLARSAGVTNPVLLASVCNTGVIAGQMELITSIKDEGYFPTTSFSMGMPALEISRMEDMGMAEALCSKIVW